MNCYFFTYLLRNSLHILSVFDQLEDGFGSWTVSIGLSSGHVGMHHGTLSEGTEIKCVNDSPFIALASNQLRHSSPNLGDLPELISLKLLFLHISASKPSAEVCSRLTGSGQDLGSELLAEFSNGTFAYQSLQNFVLCDLFRHFFT